MEIALARSVGKLADNSDRRPDHRFPRCGVRVDLGLIFHEQPLVLPHVWNVTRAKIPEARIVGVLLVLFDSEQKGTVLNQRVVYLCLEKLTSGIHWLSSLSAFSHRN